MTQSYLYMRWRGTGFPQCAVFKEIDRQLIQVGGDFGAAAPSTDERIALSAGNRVVNWNDDLYAVARSGIWKYDVEAGGPWTLAHTFSNRHLSSTNDSYRMPFTVGSVDGSPNLYTAYPSAGGNNRMVLVTITPSGGISESSEITLTSAAFNDVGGYGFCSPVAYRSSIVFANQAAFYEIDLNTLAVSRAAMAAPTHNGTAQGLCVFRDKVFALSTNGGGFGGSTYLYRKDGTTATLVSQLQNSIQPGDGDMGGLWSNTACRGLLVPYDKYMTAFFFLDGNSSHDGGGAFPVGYSGPEAVVCEFADGETSNPSITRVTFDIGLNGLWTSAGQPFGTVRWSLRRDPLTDGPDNDTMRLEYTRSGSDIGSQENNDMRLYDWSAPSGSLSFIDASMSAYRFGLVENQSTTGGANIWPGSGTINVSPPELSIDGASINARFEIYGPVGLSGIALDVYFDKEGEYTGTKATLTETTIGTLNNNQVEGLATGDVVTVKWAAALQGIGIQDNPSVAGRVFIP